jgi:hypothetical protein
MPKRLSSPLWGLTVLWLTFGLTPSNAAQLAASIEYERATSKRNGIRALLPKPLLAGLLINVGDHLLNERANDAFCWYFCWYTRDQHAEEGHITRAAEVPFRPP